MKKIDIEIVQNELNHLNEQLEKTKLISTIDGVVTYVSDAKEGDYMGAFVTIISISDPKQVQLESQFSSSGDLANVTVGMEAGSNIDRRNTKGNVLQVPSSAALYRG